MTTILAAIIAMIVILLFIILVGYVWYNFIGWKKFNFKSGDTVKWEPSSTKSDISKLRFKNCKFTVTLNDGSAKVIDVTHRLNNMATAYHKSPTKMPSSLNLDATLNPASFLIVGFNDTVSSIDKIVNTGEKSTILTGMVRSI